MSLNSVNTNMTAMIALQSLDATNTQLAITQKQISTGYRVADSTDDGAAYAIAQNIRSTVGALTSANQQLGNVQGLLTTTQSGLTNISNTMASMRDVLVKLSDGNVQSTDRTNYEQQYKSLLGNLQTFIQDASYNGKTLIGDITGSNGKFGRIAVARNESGSSYGIATFSGSALYGSIAFTSTQLGGAATVQALITATGTFLNQQNAVGEQLNTLGNAINYVNNQVTYNNNKIDALNSGLGALVDADLAKESAQLTSLQIRQQLGTQALSLANSAPNSLLSLFR
ncbi:MAG TPA: flagellin [Rhodopila sp.]|uniref:flagellin n=1 Tax=Rhodopila sp. TaxID=2480087 RepID=UPI002BDD27F7|nr:flagellin [Rhodopila sp.]HVY16493.1 flagellin [Rhodopila sp.]